MMAESDCCILVLTGPPCAGKTSVGRLVADSTRSIYVEVDAVFSLLFPGSDRNRHDRLLAYDAAHLLARGLFERGLTPILECTYARSEQRSSLVKVLAEMPEAPLRVVEIEVSPGDAVDRFRRRQQVTDLDDELVRERAEYFPYSKEALRLVSRPMSPPDELASQVVAWLHGRPQPIHQRAWADVGRGWN